MTNEHLTAVLAQKVLGWRIGPDRFLMGKRRWIPRWRFQPTENLEDAFRLLRQAGPQEFSISGHDKENIHVQVLIAGRMGEARGTSWALTITHAIARSVGIEIESLAPSAESRVKHPSSPKASSLGARVAARNGRGQS